MRTLLLVLLVCFSSVISYAQKDFEGSITYKINYLKVPAEVEGMESMLPQTLKMSFAGDKVRVEQEVMGGEQIIIANNKTKESHVLMNMMGTKIHIPISKEEVEKEEANAKPPVVTELNETKNILGYKCKKATLKDQETGNVTTVYYSKKIPIKHKDFNYLDGFPLEYQTEQDGLKMNMTASEISEEKVSAKLFEVPSGYTTMSMEELQNFGK